MKYGLTRSGKVVAMSELEDIVANELDKLRVPYIRQQEIKVAGFRPQHADFYFYGDVVWEINGTYWHTDPRVYAGKTVTQQQVQAYISYQRKLEAYEKANLIVWELWEQDIRKDPASLVEVCI